MPFDTIIKSERDWLVSPNLRNYVETCRPFSWGAAARLLDGLPSSRGLLIACEAVDRQTEMLCRFALPSPR